MLKYGVLSHSQVEARSLPFTPIYDRQIVTGRSKRVTPADKSLWNYANLYFQARNPMLYRVLDEKGAQSIVILGVSSNVLKRKDIFVSVGNAASGASPILPASEGLQAIYSMWDIVASDWWKEEDGTKRKIMAECLVPDFVSPDEIHTIYVASQIIAENLRTSIPPRVSIVPEPHMFFLPSQRTRITERLFLVDGDMFFSKLQTLTISVNTVGVMGKGLASRTRYQFPDVYVAYQDACRQKQLQVGKPYLYKREGSLDRQLADDPGSLPEINANKWFLLFPTKKNWREQSELEWIEEGLQWIVESYRREGIESLAVPALGCGLGGLEWRTVGPLMCKYLRQLDIDVAIYLPREQKIPDEMLTRQFLLGNPPSVTKV